MSSEETEDCLFLDVMVPTRIFDSQTRNRPSSWEASQASCTGAPVLVWIDGGGFSAGYKHEQIPTGLIERSLSVDGNGMIFVAMNYRVGLFVSTWSNVLLNHGREESLIRILGFPPCRYRW